MNILVILAAGLLGSFGTYLILDRRLSRIVIGIGLLSHGVNLLLIFSGGDGGDPAFVDGDTGGFADPLPQALVLTAIVITFAVIAFLLALAYRSWTLTSDDEVEDDVEDRRIAREAEQIADAGVEA